MPAIEFIQWRYAMTTRRTRDLLLPRLVSGELDVEHVEVRLPATNTE